MEAIIDLVHTVPYVPATEQLAPTLVLAKMVVLAALDCYLTYVANNLS